MSAFDLALCHHALDGEAAPALPLANIRARLWREVVAAWGPPTGPSRGPAPSSEAALLSRLQHGDPTVIDALYEAHASALLGRARRWLGPQDAEEVLLDTFLVLVHKAETLDPARPLRPFLYKVLRGKAIDRLRAAACRPSTEALEVEPLDERALQAELAREELQALARAAATLDPLEQELLILVMEGHTSPEIAARLDLKPDAARQRIATLRGRLRKAMQAGAA